MKVTHSESEIHFPSRQAGNLKLFFFVEVSFENSNPV